MRKEFLILGVCVACLFTVLSPFSISEVQATNGRDYATLANHLATLLQSARLVMARNQDIINTHGARVGEPIPEGVPVSFKGLVPAVFGRLVADDFMGKSGITLKQTTLGKGRRGPRNVYNAPDEWEKTVLEKFNSRSYPRGVGFGEFAKSEGAFGEVYRYMLPVYIEAPCLKCHGEPANSPTGDGLDVAGYPMEGYKEGELRGGISVTIPLKEVQHFSVNSKFFPSFTGEPVEGEREQ